MLPNSAATRADFRAGAHSKHWVWDAATARWKAEWTISKYRRVHTCIESLNVADGGLATGGNHGWSPYSTCADGFVAILLQHIDLHGGGP